LTIEKYKKLKVQGSRFRVRAQGSRLKVKKVRMV
jgi:hypothetical protein